MSIISVNELRSLAAEGGGMHVSIYLPTHRHYPGTEQDPIRFKNLLTAAEQRLGETGMRSVEVRDMLEPATALLRDPAFWKFQSDGLAVYISSNETHHYRLPFRFSETLAVGERFHLKPLWQVLANDQTFHILAISQKQVRLLEATGYGSVEVRLENMPESMREILDRYDFEEQLQFHTRAQAGAAVFHGQGLGQEDAYKRVIEYLREIEAGVSKTLEGESSPLVAAGDGKLIALYRSVNSYRHLADEAVTGNPDQLDDEGLRTRAWEIAEPLLSAGRQQASERFHQRIGTGRASNDLQSVVPAAYNGQIESIFIPVGVQKWGVYDQSSGGIAVHEQAAASDNDLLDFAALHTWLNQGQVYAVEADQVPGGGLLAAVYRY